MAPDGVRRARDAELEERAAKLRADRIERHADLERDSRPLLTTLKAAKDRALLRRELTDPELRHASHVQKPKGRGRRTSDALVRIGRKREAIGR